MVTRSIAQKAVTATRLTPAVAAPKMFTRAVNTKQQTHKQIKPVVTQQHDKKSEYDNYAKSRFYAWATGVAVICGCAGYQIFDNQPTTKTEKYIPPFQDARIKVYQALKSGPTKETATKYIKAFQEEEQAIMADVFKILRINSEQDRQAWEYCKRTVALWRSRWDQEKIEISKKEYSDVPENLKAMINKLLQESYINPNQIALLKGSQVAVRQRVIFVKNNSLINKITALIGGMPLWEACHVDSWTSEQKAYMAAVFMHEIQHILHDDWCGAGFIVNFPLFHLNKKIDQTALDACVLRLKILQEKRADIMAGLMNPRYAKALSGYYNQHSTLLRKANVITHDYMTQGLKFLPQTIKKWTSLEKDPHEFDWHRTAYMKKLHEEMLAEIAKNKKDVLDFQKDKDQITAWI